VVKRKTSRSRLSRGLKSLSDWCRQNQHLPVAEQHHTLSQKLVGHFAYYGITGNSVALSLFRRAATHIWRRWLSRRRRDGHIPWEDFNRFLERALGLPRLLRMFLTVVTILFVLACLRRLVRGYRKAEPAATLTPAARDSLLPRGGVVRQRTAAQIEVGNLYEAARRRVRERFDVLGARPGASGQMPPILTANDLPDGPLLYQSVRWLWALGYGETPLAVPAGDWDRTNVLLERVTARAARGDWSFGQETG